MHHIDPIDPTLIVSALTGRASEDELRELTAWRARSRANEDEYRRLARLWLAAGESTPRAAAPNPPDVAVIVARADGRRQQRRDAPMVARPRTRRLRTPVAVWAAGGLAASLVLGLGIGRWLAPVPFGLASLTTGANEVATITLEDQTVVRLAPESTLRFPRGDGAREVALVGRAFFTVARDPERPFRVRLPSGEIEVLGTRFDVQGRDLNLQVAVVEGHVRLQAQGARLDLEANDVAHVPRDGVPEVRRVEDPYEVIDWLGRFLAFDSTPLGEVAEEFERRFGIRLDVSAELRFRTLTGWFADQTPDAMVAGICTVLEAQCSFEGDVVRLQSAAEGPRGEGARS